MVAPLTSSGSLAERLLRGLSLRQTLSPGRMEASDLSSPGSTAQQCTGCPQRSWPACRCDGPGGSSLPAAVGTSMLGARCQVRPSCRAFVHSVRWELAPPFSQQRKLRCRRVRWPFPADSGDEGRLSFGLRSVRFRSPGPPGRLVSGGACCQGTERGSYLCRVPGRVIVSGAVLGQGPEEPLQGRMGPCELQERTQKPLSSHHVFSFLSPSSRGVWKARSGATCHLGSSCCWSFPEAQGLRMWLCPGAIRCHRPQPLQPPS